MATRTPDDLMDERLRAAGARLRHDAPSPVVTDAALAAVNQRGRASRPLRWVVPVGFVAAAAAALGVLALTGGADEAEPEVPAVTPPVTAEPTVPATPAPTTAPPVFVGDPPLTASAAALGCDGTLGDFAAALTSAAAPITRLACFVDPRSAQALSGDQLISFHQFEDDHVWREVGREPSEACPERCLLPIPPASLLERDLGDLPPIDETELLHSYGLDDVEFENPQEVADAVVTRMGGRDALDQVDVIDGTGVLVMSYSSRNVEPVVGITRVIWYSDSGVERAFFIYDCRRGAAVDEAGQPTDLCR